MSAVLDLPAPTKEELEAPDFDPVPHLALACGASRLTDFRPAHRHGNYWRRSFEIEERLVIDGCAVRYSEALPFVTFLPFTSGWVTHLERGDVMTVMLG